MRKIDAVFWTGKNLEEVIEFIGKSLKFNDWFKSWEEYEKFVHEHGDIVKLFAPDGLSVDVLPGTWIVKTPEGFNVPMTNPWLKANKSEPQGLDETAEEYAEKNKNEWEVPIESLIYGTPRTRTANDKWEIKDAFKAGANWMAEQGYSSEAVVGSVILPDGEYRKVANFCSQSIHAGMDNLNLSKGDKVIVQIRKK